MYPFCALAWAAADAFESEVLKENGQVNPSSYDIRENCF